jgi:putative NADH-flavin reductase
VVSYGHELFLLGATGKTGREIMDLALDRGHRVTAFVRSPHELVRRSDRLTVRQGDALDANALSAALQFAFFRWFMRHHARGLTAMETVIKATDLDWTIARPPRLVRSADARYRSRSDALPDGSMTAGFRVVAAFMLAAIETGQHSKQVVGVVR